MRPTVRLLAPLSILATALYLAFWASQHSESKQMPITSLEQQSIDANPKIGAQTANAPAASAKPPKFGTSGQIHP